MTKAVRSGGFDAEEMNKKITKYTHFALTIAAKPKKQTKKAVQNPTRTHRSSSPMRSVGGTKKELYVVIKEWISAI